MKKLFVILTLIGTCSQLNAWQYKVTNINIPNANISVGFGGIPQAQTLNLGESHLFGPIAANCISSIRVNGTKATLINTDQDETTLLTMLKFNPPLIPQGPKFRNICSNSFFVVVQDQEGAFWGIRLTNPPAGWLP